MALLSNGDRPGPSPLPSTRLKMPPVTSTQGRSTGEEGAVRPRCVDTVIVGSGPAALILSYILNGYQPVLRADATHPDPQLQAKLARIPALLQADFHHLAAHFPASRFSYSTQALPVNTLLDTLLRPLGDTAPGVHPSCIEWRRTGPRIDHVVLGLEQAAGGQWQANPVQSSADIPALSYADLLSLPGYSMTQYLHDCGIQDDMGFLRPTRRHVADYLAIWPQKVGISSSLQLGRAVHGVKRNGDQGFHIASHHLRCRRLVLATGTFTELIPPRELLQPLLHLKPPMPVVSDAAPLLVVGSGFSAADIILTALPAGRRVLHIFKWASSDVASPLRACHPSAYPEYASVFRRMKRAASQTVDAQLAPPDRRTRRRKSSASALEHPEWDRLYEGLPNATIQSVTVRPDDSSAMITLEQPEGRSITRDVSGMQYVTGRRGSMAYLDRGIRAEVLSPGAPLEVIAAGGPLQARMLRAKVERSATFEMDNDVYMIGSLLGDSLVRHAYGGCCVVAKELLTNYSAERAHTTPIAEAQTDRTTISKNHTEIKAASEEVAEAVALALSGDLPPPPASLSAATVKKHEMSTWLVHDPYSISLEFSEPPQRALPAPKKQDDMDDLPVLNDHEHLGDAKPAVLGSRMVGCSECSDLESGVMREGPVSGEEVVAC